MIEANPELIKQNFSKIAQSYDLANDAMTLGLLRLWRRKLVRASQVKEGDQVLDVASGTGDLALLFQKKVGQEGRVIALDLTAEMLAIGQVKAQTRGISNITWKVGDAQKLPFHDHSFDICSIAFGIRNVQFPTLALKEMARVTRPGGRLMILETGLPQAKIWRGFYRVFMQTLIPEIGGRISGHPGPYRFLQRSTFEFPCADDFLKIMKNTGCFSQLKFEPLLGGAAYLYTAVI